MRILTLFIIIFSSWNGLFAYNDHALESSNLPQDFVRKVKFATPKSGGAQTDKVIKIRYGNEDIGYFETEQFKIENREIHLDILPPTYKKPVKFFAIFVSKGARSVLLGTLSFSNELLTSLQPTITSEGRFSFPYFFLNIDVSRKQNLLRTLPAILNTKGELIWIYSRPGNLQTKSLYGYQIVAAEKSFLLLSRRQETELVSIDGLGREPKIWNFRSERPGNSHAFDFDEKSNSIFYLGFDCRELQASDEFIPLFTGLFGTFRKYFSPKRSYLGAKLIQFNLQTNQINVLWSTFDSFHPANNRTEERGNFLYFDPFVSMVDMAQYRRVLAEKPEVNWFDWPMKKCDVDWSHENSVKFYKGKGFLISIRNLNKIIFMDENGKLKWKLGTESGDHFQFQKESQGFSMQHGAQLLSESKILTYDNHETETSPAKRYLSSRVMLIDISKSGKIPEPEVYPLPFPKSLYRGSAESLPSGKIFAYLAGDRGMDSFIYEIDTHLKAPIARIKADIFTPFKAIESRPIFSLFGEKWDPPAQKDDIFSIKRQEETLEYSY